MNVSTLGYAEHVRGAKYQQSLDFLAQHGILESQCILVKGYFQDTLTPEFHARYTQEGRHIGFAFLDCNITSSYQICLDFIRDFVGAGTYVYMDEYFINHDVPAVFGDFSERLQQRKGLRSIFIRNAGTFGALFVLQAHMDTARSSD